MTARRRRIVRVEDLVGRRVSTADGTVVGRIEEIRARRRNDEHEVTEYLLGTGALLERLALVQRLFGRRRRTLVARWDQIDISRPDKPTLTCGVDELRHVDR
jgi:sporulation protein YlmC with PRC-barrel domain